MSTTDTAPPRTHRIRNYLVGLCLTVLAVVVVAAVVVAVRTVDARRATDQRQAALAPFYQPPAGWVSQSPGAVLRTQPISGVPAGGRGWRILYRSQRSDGTPTVSSGLVFAPGPTAPAAPAGGRVVLAWTHGTTGMGDACAPSRTATPTVTVPGLDLFLQAGWVVAATDYSGLGTPGTEEYLIGAAEARDALNSVRAARQMPAADQVDAGPTVLVFGHSQGGASALWTAQDAPTYAPDLHVVATAAAAPAADLDVLIAHQWNTLVGTLIGAEVLRAWPGTQPGLDPAAVTTASPGRIASLADGCLSQVAGRLALAKIFGTRPIFDRNPADSAPWRAAIVANSPPPPPVPTLVVQETTDGVVLAGSNAAWMDGVCADRAAAPTSAWYIGGVGSPDAPSGLQVHLVTGKAAAPLAFTWFQQRLSGVPATSTCGTLSPVTPLAG